MSRNTVCYFQDKQLVYTLLCARQCKAEALTNNNFYFDYNVYSQAQPDLGIMQALVSLSVFAVLSAFPLGMSELPVSLEHVFIL